jgi:hypothetical protein
MLRRGEYMTVRRSTRARAVIPLGSMDRHARNLRDFAQQKTRGAVVLAPTLAGVYIDQEWYLAHSPDVADAITKGEFASAQDHYAKVGFYEHRMPYEIEVDETWYLENYPDIAAAVEKGVFPTGRAHFYQLGYREGRFPHPNFTLRAASAPPEHH